MDTFARSVSVEFSRNSILMSLMIPTMDVLLIEILMSCDDDDVVTRIDEHGNTDYATLSMAMRQHLRNSNRVPMTSSMTIFTI